MVSSEVKAHLVPYEERASALREELAVHEHRYHVLGYPVISRSEYARLRRELVELEAKGVAVTLDSASRRRGGIPRPRFEVEEHREPWPELARVQSVAELRAYHGRLAELEGADPAFVATATIPGQEIELTYQRGLLVRALTRGDGRRGEDITDNARTVGSIPLVLRPAGSRAESRATKLTREALGPSTMSPVPSFPEELHVRGIVSMRTSDITALDRRRVDSGEAPYILPRSSVMCSLRRLDPKISASRRLVFFATGCDRTPPGIESEWQLLSALKAWGFSVLPITWRCTGLNEILDFIATLHQTAPSFEFPLEGGTLRLNRLGARARGQNDPLSPLEAVSLTFPPPGRHAVVSGVYFAVGRGGAILPVALMEKAPGHDLPVPERAPIPAESIDTMLPVKKGSSIRVRPGSVAPIIALEQYEGGVLSIESCPICASSLRRAGDEPFGHCENPSCRGRARARLLHLIGQRGLKMESVHVRIIDRLIVEPGVSDAADLLALDPAVVDQVAPGRRKAFEQDVARAKQLPLWRFLYLMAIPHVSEHAARAIAQHVFDVTRLEKMTEDEVSSIPHVAPEALRGLWRWLCSEGPRMLRRLRQSGVEILDGERSFAAPFLEKLVCVAGELTAIGNVQAMDEIERRGGTIVQRVGRTTDFLIAGKGAQKALDLAKQYEVLVLEEEVLAYLLETT